MTIDSLRSFMTALEDAGELIRVHRPVSVVHEITEIADRCMKGPGGLWYAVGVLCATGILAYEHRLVKAGDVSRLDAAFFRMNGVMSIVVALFAFLDRAV